MRRVKVREAAKSPRPAERFHLLHHPGTDGMCRADKSHIILIFLSCIIRQNILRRVKHRAEQQPVSFRVRRVKGQHLVVLPHPLPARRDILHGIPEVQHKARLGERRTQHGNNLHGNCLALDHKDLIVSFLCIFLDDLSIIVCKYRGVAVPAHADHGLTDRISPWALIV